MHVGVIFVWLLPLALLLKTVLPFQKGLDNRLSLIINFLPPVISTALLLLIGFAFLSQDYSLALVDSYVSSSMDWWQRIAMIWTNEAGSLFLLIWFTSMTTITQGLRAEKSNGVWWQLSPTQITSAILFIFSISLVFLEPFSTNTSTDLNGASYDPQLLTIWSAIHPPLTLLGAAITIPLFGLSFAYLLSPSKSHYLHPLTLLIRQAWLWITLGIVTGGLWAYLTPGWGGWWSWDPVEVAALLVWGALTILLHDKPIKGGRRGWELRKAYLATFPFLFVLLTAFVVRSGVWISIHGYLAGGSGTLYSRFKMALMDPGIAPLFCLMLVILEFSWFAFLTSSARLNGHETAEEKNGLKIEGFEDTRLTPQSKISSTSPELEIEGFEDTLLTPLSITRWTMLVGLVFTLTLLLIGAWRPTSPSGYESRLAVLVLLLIGLFIWQIMQNKTNGWRFYLLHLGVLLIVVGHGVSVTQSSHWEVEIEVGQQVAMGPYQIEVQSITPIITDFGERLEVEYYISDNEGVISRGAVSYVWYEPQRVWLGESETDFGLLSDFQVSVIDADETSTVLLAEEVSGTTFVILGLLLMSASFGIKVANSRRKHCQEMLNEADSEE